MGLSLISPCFISLPFLSHRRSCFPFQSDYENAYEHRVILNLVLISNRTSIIILKFVEDNLVLFLFEYYQKLRSLKSLFYWYLWVPVKKFIFVIDSKVCLMILSSFCKRLNKLIEVPFFPHPVKACSRPSKRIFFFFVHLHVSTLISTLSWFSCEMDKTAIP